MSSIIRIKRSGTNGTPSTLTNGELAYSYANAGVGGQRLYIGVGDGPGGNAADIVTIGGKYYTDLLRATPGELLENAALITDSLGRIDEINVGNLEFSANVIAASNTNGEIVLTPQGTGVVRVNAATSLVIPVGDDTTRYTGIQGAIRFNTAIGQFEGFDGGNWRNLGGVRSVDGRTRIDAELTIGDNTLYFYTDNVLRATLSTNEFRLQDEIRSIIESTIESTSSSTGALTVFGGAGIGGNIHAGGSINAPTVNAGNIRTTGNTISATNTEGSIILQPAVGGEVDVSGFRIINLNTPLNSGDAVNKSYVDEVAQGITARPAVRAATTVNLNADYNNGDSGVGATLTAISEGALPAIDGVGDWLPGDGILVKNQLNPEENGRYVITTVGDSGEKWVLTRCRLCDDVNEIPSSFVFVQEGTTFANTGWVATVTNLQEFEVGVSPIIWVQFSGAGSYTTGAGLSLDGTRFDVNVANGIVIDGANNVALSPDLAGTGMTFDSGVLNVNGTANRIAVNGTSIDISNDYVGQTSISVVGTIGTGTWQGTAISVEFGGTGVSSFTPNAVFSSNSSGNGINFVTGSEGDFISFNDQGEVVSTNVVDGGTY